MMLKKTTLCVLIVFFVGGLAAQGGFNAGARTGGGAAPENRQQAGASQLPPAVDAAARDEALAAITKRLAGREDELAEQVFKNIEILKGKKASRLPGMMSALTGLLGVNCTHCHVKDKWDSEEKPAKQTTRRHFEMQAQMNKEFFAGRNAITCWTCHRGQPKPAKAN